MDANSLKSLVGKDVTAAINSGIDLGIFIENNIELRISNNTNAWRFFHNLIKRNYFTSVKDSLYQ